MTQSAGTDPLAGLRGYHLPDPVSWWPPAPGWWLLAGLLVVASLAATAWLQRRRRRRAAAWAALAELEALRSAYDRERDPAGFLRGVSRLLRRFALARFPRREVAGLVGTQWLAFLDRYGGEGAFAEGPGRLLADAPYRPSAEIRPEQLAALARGWIEHNLEPRP